MISPLKPTYIVFFKTFGKFGKKSSGLTFLPSLLETSSVSAMPFPRAGEFTVRKLFLWITLPFPHTLFENAGRYGNIKHQWHRHLRGFTKTCAESVGTRKVRKERKMGLWGCRGYCQCCLNSVIELMFSSIKCF